MSVPVNTGGLPLIPVAGGWEHNVAHLADRLAAIEARLEHLVQRGEVMQQNIRLGEIELRMERLSKSGQGRWKTLAAIETRLLALEAALNPEPSLEVETEKPEREPLVWRTRLDAPQCMTADDGQFVIGVRLNGNGDGVCFRAAEGAASVIRHTLDEAKRWCEERR